MNDAKTFRIVAAVALMLGAGLFALGVAREHASPDVHQETVTSLTVTPSTSPSGEGTSGEGTDGETAGGETGGGESGGETTSGADASSETTSESRNGSDATLLGIDLEGSPFVIVALVASVALAIALVVLRSRALLVLTIVIALTFAIADVREVFHQLHERPGIAALATAVALAHVIAAAAAARGARLTRPELIRDAAEVH
jgi:hypothetical protein